MVQRRESDSFQGENALEFVCPQVSGRGGTVNEIGPFLPFLAGVVFSLALVVVAEVLITRRDTKRLQRPESPRITQPKLDLAHRIDASMRDTEPESLGDTLPSSVEVR